MKVKATGKGDIVTPIQKNPEGKVIQPEPKLPPDTTPLPEPGPTKPGPGVGPLPQLPEVDDNGFLTKIKENKKLWLGLGIIILLAIIIGSCG